MELYIKIKDADSLPTIEDLKRVMFFENASVSRFGNDHLLRKGAEIALSWDKWIDDPRWSHHSKSKEYIYIQFIQPNIVKVEVDDSATFVDRRAAILAGKFIVDIDDGDSSYDNEKWLQKKDFIRSINKYLHFSFQSAVEQSLIAVL
ncbi:hypothetical protein [Gorillibacterium timonense]|uniref:hypothetical protein n=1 Tax=Gorillibacterium timonense TaxID=1689269 RepID=UPI00071C2E8F|nr:hypothetical protein [Gorillibacterium timonense]